MPQNKNKRGNGDMTPILPGMPGFRNRPKRSGLDPVDTYREEAFMEGVFYRRLFTLQVRTRNRFYLALMTIGGVALLALSVPFLIGIWENTFRNVSFLRWRRPHAAETGCRGMLCFAC